MRLQWAPTTSFDGGSYIVKLDHMQNHETHRQSKSGTMPTLIQP